MRGPETLQILAFSAKKKGFILGLWFVVGGGGSYVFLNEYIWIMKQKKASCLEFIELLASQGAMGGVSGGKK